MRNYCWAVSALRAEEFAAASERRMALAWAGLAPSVASVKVAGAGTVEGVVVIDLSGPLYSRSLGFGDSYEELARDLDALAADSDVRAVLMRLDSPGGEVPNVQIAADALRRLAAKKPVWSVADPMAASAAYWIASQANKLFVTTGGLVGSIGAIIRHVDGTKAAEQTGLKVTEVVFGSRKNEFSPLRPLDDQGRAHLQAFVDEAGEAFVGAVAVGRRLSAERIRATEGRLMTGRQAAAAGLVDGEATAGEALAGLVAVVRGGGSGIGARAGVSLSVGGGETDMWRRAQGVQAPNHERTPNAALLASVDQLNAQQRADGIDYDGGGEDSAAAEPLAASWLAGANAGLLAAVDRFNARQSGRGVI